MTLVRIVEELSRAYGSVGWCTAIWSGSGVFGGYLPMAATRDIYRNGPDVRVAGAFRPFGEAVVVDGGYRVTGRWPLGSGCEHSPWLLGGCRTLDGSEPRLSADGTPVTRILLFPAGDCDILDTWHSIGLRGTGSHDVVVTDIFVPAARSMSFREPPAEPGPLYAMPTIALFGTVLAAVSLGIARHAIDILRRLAGTKVASRSRQALREDATMQADLGRAEALLRSGRAFMFEALADAWQAVGARQTLSLEQRNLLWLSSTHAATTARRATELMFSAGGSASPYASAGLERCMRDILAAGQHLTVAPPNYQMAGQAFLGLDMRASPLLFMDDRTAG
jgi:alkylation response protein AidB-like acyl-CoA dehydrogenase